jgi:hypothetical protein
MSPGPKIRLPHNKGIGSRPDFVDEGDDLFADDGFGLLRVSFLI